MTTQGDLLGKYKSLPEDVRQAIFSVDTADLIQAIGKKHGLSIEKIGKLGDETGKIMMGLAKPQEFIGNLSKALEVDKGAARNIAQDVNQKIFASIRESLKKIHKIGETPEAQPEKVEPQKEVRPQEKEEVEPRAEPKLEPKPKIAPMITPDTPLVAEEKPVSKSEEPKEESPFEQKMSEQGFRAPKEGVDKKVAEKKENKEPYKSEDPYREPLE